MGETNPTAASKKAPATQPKEFPVRLVKEEWTLIHSDKPEAIYELRPRAWRPSQQVIAKDCEPCVNCGARTQEMIAADASRCMGCGSAVAKS